ncbi:MAG: phage baseplate assembly protein V [Aliidongia sp.]
MSGFRAAHQAAALSAAPRFAIVDSYDPTTYRAKVVLAPSADGMAPLTGYLPVLTGFMGNGWGIAAPLQKGDQVVVIFVQNHPDQGVILGRIFDQPHLPPLRTDGQAATAGEIILVHASGSRLQVTNDQKVLINGAVEIDLAAPTIDITATTAVNVTAPAINVGSSGESLQTLMTQAAQNVLVSHTHSGVAGGGGNTGPMVQSFPGNSLTTALKAG